MAIVAGLLTTPGPAATAAEVAVAEVRAANVTVAPKPGDTGALQSRKKQLDDQVAAAGDMYEAAGKAVQDAAMAYVRASAELPDAQAALITANGAQIAASVAYDMASTHVTEASTAAATARAKVAAAQAKVVTARRRMSAVLTASYEGSQYVQLDAVINADTPGGLLTQITYLDLMFVHQKQALGGLIATRQKAEQARDGAVIAQRQALDAQSAAATALAGKQYALTAALAAKSRVEALVTQRRAALAVAGKHRADTLAEYQKLQQLSDEVQRQLAVIAAQLRRQRQHRGSGGSSGSAGSGDGSVTAMSGYFLMPVHGRESSPFGMRFDPFYKRWQLHAGVDIAAAGGTPIRAAASGRVIRAGWSGGYGNYTCISHGIYTGSGPYHDQGIATCYGHQSRIGVRVGQRVSRGQVIGRVGETGAATGYHLHFEVRINGRPIQPVTWLPHCWC